MPVSSERKRGIQSAGSLLPYREGKRKLPLIGEIKENRPAKSPFTAEEKGALRQHHESEREHRKWQKGDPGGRAQLGLKQLNKAFMDGFKGPK